MILNVKFSALGSAECHARMRKIKHRTTHIASRQSGSDIDPPRL